MILIIMNTLIEQVLIINLVAYCQRTPLENSITKLYLLARPRALIDFIHFSTSTIVIDLCRYCFMRPAIAFTRIIVLLITWTNGTLCKVTNRILVKFLSIIFS